MEYNIYQVQHVVHNCAHIKHTQAAGKYSQSLQERARIENKTGRHKQKEIQVLVS